MHFVEDFYELTAPVNRRSLQLGMALVEKLGDRYSAAILNAMRRYSHQTYTAEEIGLF